VDGVLDMGAKAISAIASVIEAKEEGEIEQIVAQIPDPLRTFNRFAIGASLLRRKTI
jgi:F420-non-reducing hydrogenase small subunit